MLYQLIGGKNQVKIFFFSKCLLKSKRKKNNNIYVFRKIDIVFLESKFIKSDKNLRHF